MGARVSLESLWDEAENGPTPPPGPLVDTAILLALQRRILAAYLEEFLRAEQRLVSAINRAESARALVQTATYTLEEAVRLCAQSRDTCQF